MPELFNSLHYQTIHTLWLILFITICLVKWSHVVESHMHFTSCGGTIPKPCQFVILGNYERLKNYKASKTYTYCHDNNFRNIFTIVFGPYMSFILRPRKHLLHLPSSSQVAVLCAKVVATKPTLQRIGCLFQRSRSWSNNNIEYMFLNCFRKMATDNLLSQV